MKYLKIYENFNIDKYLDIINKYNNIELDPFGEEEWDEIEDGDLMFTIDKFDNINIKKYKQGEKTTFYKKLTEASLLKELIKVRNRDINKNKLESEKIHIKINNLTRTFEEKMEEYFKKGDVINSDRNVSLDDIKNEKIDSFDLYHIIDEDKQKGVDKYQGINRSIISENKDDDVFMDEWWDEVEKYKNDINISLNKKTYNFRGEGGGTLSLGYNLYYPQLEYMVNEGEIILECVNVKDKIKKYFKYQLDNIVKGEIEKLKYISDKMSKIDDKLNKKIEQIKQRFPQINIPI